MKKVLLVNTNTEKAPYPVPPLGLALVASGLPSNEFDVRLFDGTFRDPSHLADEIATWQPDFVGVGVRNIDDVVMDKLTYYVDDLRRDFIDPIRRATDVPLILGGAGFSMFARPLMDLLRADFGVVGEGEGLFPRLLQALDEGRDPRVLPGVIARGRCLVSPPVTFPGDGALTTPWARLDQWLDFAPYRGRGSYPIQTKRGCSHLCVYCSYCLIEGRQYRRRSPQDVVDEMEDAQRRLGPVTFEFVDSTFNDPRDHAEAICREILRRGLSCRLRTMGVNPGQLTAELVTLMRDAGFAQIDCTPDSASPTMLRNLRKNFTRKKLDAGARLIRDLQMPTMWFFLFGGPGETAETVRETFAFVDEFIAPEDMVHMTPGLRIYPGTELRDIAVREGSIAADDDLLRPRFYVSPALGREDLSRLVQEAAARRPNCVPAAETTPDPEMMRAAMQLREQESLTEPMFRTLLRVRRQRMGK